MMKILKEKNNFKRILIYIYVILIIIFIAYFFIKKYDILKLYFTNFNPIFLIYSAICIIIYLTIYGIIWSKLQQKIQKVNKKINFITWLKIFIYGFMGRYIPGKLPMILGRILFLEKFGYSKKAIAISSLYENILMMLNGAIISIIILHFYTNIINVNINLLILLTILFSIIVLIFISTSLFYKSINIILKILKRKIIDNNLMLKKKNILYTLLVFSLVTIFSGLAFYFFKITINPSYNILKNIPFSIAVINLSIIIGVLAIIFPSGLGVREGVMVVLLKTIMPKDLAILIAICYRAFTILMELLYFGIITGISLLFKKNKI